MRRARIQLICLLALLFGKALAQNPGGISVGLKPLTELGSELYHGFQGGLYPGGVNRRPSQHDSAGLAITREVLPLSRMGTFDAINGRIVLLSIGMSNTTQEFSAFKPVADADAAKNPRLVIVDGAQGGQTASIIANPSAAFWKTVDQRLQTAGVSNQQVQVVWLKEADAGPSSGFPAYAQTLSAELGTIVRLLKSFYPNVRMVYLSSRTYAGYATSTLNPEPYAYESGFSVKWLLERQINGDTSLAYATPLQRAPWLAWGPYLWADGLTRRADSLIWQASDFQSDGTHPSPNGQKKVAAMLLAFFRSEPTAVPWFLKSEITGTPAVSKPPGVEWSVEKRDDGVAVSVRLPAFSGLSVKIYNLLGQEVANVLNDVRPAGWHTVRWNASGMPSGVYICRLSIRDMGSSGVTFPYIGSRKVVIVR